MKAGPKNGPEAFDLIKIQAEQLELNRSVPAGDPDRYVAR
jgi:hypothetical protein